MFIKSDSRMVNRGDWFVALRGHRVDGHSYAEDAINRGASYVVLEKSQGLKNEIIVSDTYQFLCDFLEKECSDRVSKLKLIGVTGTNGKTTICFLIYSLMWLLDIKCAYIGTIGYYRGKKIKNLSNTTPDILEIYNLLMDAYDNGMEYVVMEVSSHALDYRRVEGLKYDVLVFTNLTEDHLDHHKSMGNYLQSKLKIFNYFKDKGTIIVNGDSYYGKYFMRNDYKLVGKKGDYRIISYKNGFNGTDIVFGTRDREYRVHINLINLYNVYNYLMAVAVMDCFGVSLDRVIEVSDRLQAPKGRCDMIGYEGALIVVDYAHTPDAVNNVIAGFRKMCAGEIVVVIGCGGNRDRKKRPIMGHSATEYGDFVIFTNDNPRGEDENVIMEDILAGVSRDNYVVIYDRKEAIEAGIDRLHKGDILLILGKGHEDYQIVMGDTYHFDDKECAEEYIKKKEKGSNV